MRPESGAASPRPKKSPLVTYDTRDDRAEIAALVRKLPPLDRVRFVQWCCDRAYLAKRKPGPHLRPKVASRTVRLARAAHAGDSAADERLLVEVYGDIWRLCAQYESEISFEAALAELVRRVRRA